MLIAKASTENSIEIFRRASLKSEPVIFSTDTIYGIGAPVSDISANKKIFDIKDRDKTKPFPILISSLDQLKEIAVIETDAQREIIDEVWPGPVTIILKALAGLNPLFCLNGTVAVRMPSKKWLRELINYTGALSATSANKANVKYDNSEKVILKTFNNSVYFYIFDNNIQNTSSSIVDISKDTPAIIRAGENVSLLRKFT